MFPLPKKELILQISTKYPPLQKIFTKRVNFLNNLFSLTHIHAYFETIEGGLIWIFQNISDFQKVATTTARFLEPFHANKTPLLSRIKNGILRNTKAPKQGLIFQVKSVFHPFDQIEFILTPFLSSLNSDIQIRRTSEKTADIVFKTLRSLLDYMGFLHFAMNSMLKQIQKK